MKKIFAGFCLLSLVFLTTGCEKKQKVNEGIVTAGKTYEVQVWTAEEPKAIEALMKEYLAKNPLTGLKIEVVPFSTEEFLQQTLLEKMAENKGPDLIFTTGEWVHQNPEKLIPVAQTEGFTSSRFATTFVRAASEAMIQNDEIYGLPMAVDSLAIFYNEDHLISNLINRNSPGLTWQEFRQDIEKLTKEDNSLERFAVSGAAIGRMDNLNYGFEILENMMLQMGAKFFTEDGTEASFASSVGVMPNGQRKNFGEESTKFFTSFAKQQYKNYCWNELLANPNSENKDFETFLKGKTSMVFGFSRDFARLKSMVKNWKTVLGRHISEDNIRVSFFPQFSAQNGLGTKLVKAKVYGFAVPRTAAHPAFSWKILKFLAKKEIATSFHKSTSLPTARLDLIMEQSAEPEIGIFVRQAKFAKNNFVPFLPLNFREKFSNLVQRIVDKKLSNVLKPLSKLEKEISRNLKEYLTLSSKINRVAPVKKTPPTPKK